MKRGTETVEDARKANKRHFERHYEENLKAGSLQETVDRFGGDEELAGAFLDYTVGGRGGYLDLDKTLEAFAKVLSVRQGSDEFSDRVNAEIARLLASERIAREAAGDAKPWEG